MYSDYKILTPFPMLYSTSLSLSFPQWFVLSTSPPLYQYVPPASPLTGNHWFVLHICESPSKLPYSKFYFVWLVDIWLFYWFTKRAPHCTPSVTLPVGYAGVTTWNPTHIQSAVPLANEAMIDLCLQIITCVSVLVFLSDSSSVQGQRQPAPHVSGLGWPVKPPASQVLWCARLTSSFWFAVYAWKGTRIPRSSPVCTLSARGKPLCSEKGVSQTDFLQPAKGAVQNSSVTYGRW